MKNLLVIWKIKWKLYLPVFLKKDKNHERIILIQIIKQIRESISKDIFYIFNNKNENLNKSTYIPSLIDILIWLFWPIEFQSSKIILFNIIFSISKI